ncbi:MAG: hypothetical protein ABSE77_16085 [Acidimicrobiales bacterium]|jgi:hypothetical protein
MSGGRRTSASAAGTEVVHRGVRWRRSASRRVSWFNEGMGRWVVWAPGSDAPPLPPDYAASGDAVAGAPVQTQPAETAVGVERRRPVDAMSGRKPMTSPYRLAPLLIAVLVIAIALWQATRPPAHATQADIAAAQALKGKCLRQQGGTRSAPVYSPTPITCQSAGASVRVVTVLVPGRAGTCPVDSAVVQVLQAGVVGEPSECVLPVRVK